MSFFSLPKVRFKKVKQVTGKYLKITKPQMSKSKQKKKYSDNNNKKPTGTRILQTGQRSSFFSKCPSSGDRGAEESAPRPNPRRPTVNAKAARGGTRSGSRHPRTPRRACG